MKIEPSADQTEPSLVDYGIAPVRFEKIYYGERRVHCNGVVWVEETTFSGEAHAAVCLTSRRVLPFHLIGVYDPPSFCWGYTGYQRDVAVVVAVLDRLTLEGETANGRVLYRERQAVVLQAPATVQLHPEHFVEKLPADFKFYWNHLSASQQFELPFDV